MFRLGSKLCKKKKKNNIHIDLYDWSRINDRSCNVSYDIDCDYNRTNRKVENFYVSHNRIEYVNNEK